jgi:FixJ family two-component response regulator
MNRSEYVVFLVDDDVGVLKALTRSLEGKGYNVRAFSSAREFLLQHDPAVPGCAIFDVSMPELDGLELQAKLGEGGAERPIIFITGMGEVPTSVKAMKAGAVDFLMKPVKSKVLLAAIAEAFEKEARQRQRRRHEVVAHDRIARLTAREREVMTYVIAGLLNKQIAARLGIVEKTIKLHRGRMMHKLGVKSVPELIRVAEDAGIHSAAQ